MNYLTKSKKKISVFAMALILLVTALSIMIQQLTTVYAHASSYQLKHVIAASELTDNNIVVDFSSDGETKTVVVPELNYYDFGKEVYDGRIKQAIIKDHTSGLMSLRLICYPKPSDLPKGVSEEFDCNVFELHYYEKTNLTLYCAYFSSSEVLENYVSERLVDINSPELQDAVSGDMSYYKSFMKNNPLIYDIYGNRVEAYPQSSNQGIMNLTTQNDDVNTPAECYPGLFDQYTVSDGFFNGSNKTIRDYIYGSNNGSISDGIKISNDDIVQIVPYELFRKRGTYLYVGQQYGFFVQTTWNQDHGGNCNTVDVGVFDITYTDGAPANNGAEIETRVEVKFLYHHTYSYLTKSDIGESLWLETYDNSLSEIVCGSRFEEWDEYYIHNVSFAALMYDEVKPNPGYKDYYYESDDATHLIQTRYNFYGSSLKNSDPGNAGFATAKFAFNMIGKLPGPTGVVGKVGGGIVKTVEFIKNFENPFTPKYDDWNMGNEINIRMPQPGDEDYRSDICYRGAATELAAPSNGNVALLRTNQRAEIIYLLGNYYDNWTRIYNTIDVSVSRLDRGMMGTSRDLDPITNGGSTYYRHLQDRGPSVQSISVNEIKNVNVLPQGFNRFEFVPEYSGDYLLNFVSNNNVKVVIRNANRDVIKTLDNNKSYTYTFTGDGTIKYYLDVYLTDDFETERFNFSLKLKPMLINSSETRTFNAKSSWAKNFSVSNTDTYRIYSGNENIGIKVISSLGTVESAVGSPNLFYRFSQGIDYIIVFFNRSTAQFSGNTAIYPIESLTLNSSREISSYSGLYYVTYENNTNQAQTVVFSANGIQGYEYDWDIKTSNWTEATATVFTGEGVVRVPVAVGQKIYIGLNNKTNSYKSISMMAQLNNVAYRWYVKVGEEQDFVLEQDAILELRRGASAEILFYVGNIQKNSFTYQSNNNFTVNGNKITIKADARLGTTSYFEADKITEYPLAIKPMYESQFTYDIINSDDLYMSWGNYKGLSMIGFTISTPGGETENFETNDLYGSTNGKYYINYQNGSNPYNFVNIVREIGYTGWNNCTIRINWIDIAERDINVYNPTWTYRIYNGSSELNIADKTFDPLFGGGNGQSEKPHIISSVRHLNNIRYRVSPMYDGYTYVNYIYGDYKLTKNIDLSASHDWTPIPYTFKGYIHGNRYNLSNLKITIPSTVFEENEFKNYGLFEIFSGTAQNIDMYNVKIYGDSVHSGEWVSVGSFAGTLDNGTLNSCYVYGEKIEVNRRYSWVGALAGEVINYGIIQNSENHADIKSNGEVGGIAGITSFNGAIENCTNHGNIEYYLVEVDPNFNNAGGIVGRLIYSARVTNCKNHGTVKYTREKMEENTSLAPCMGGIIGRMYGDASESENETEYEPDKGSLYTFSTGALWWKKEYDQGRNCHEIVGLIG